MADMLNLYLCQIKMENSLIGLLDVKAAQASATSLKEKLAKKRRQVDVLSYCDDNNGDGSVLQKFGVALRLSFLA